MPAPHSPDGEITIPPPPDVPKDPPVNVVARLLPLGSLLAMGGMTMLYVASGAASSRSPMFLFFPGMMLVSVLGSVAYQSRAARRGTELDEDRRRYLRRLDDLDATLAEVAEAQADALLPRHPDPASLWTLAGGERRWERRVGDVDFCHVRVGLGARPLATALVAPALGPVDGRDPVTAEAVTHLMVRRSTVPDVPITVDLSAHARIAVEGPPAAARGLVRAMVCQLTLWHGPDVVGVSVVGGRADDEWDWLKWLPHHERSDGIRRLVIVDGGADDASGDGTTVVTVGGATGDCLRLDADGADAMSASHAVAFARSMARYRPAAKSDAEGWPRLVGIADPAHLDVRRLWRSRPDRGVLRVPIGLDEAGKPVELDLKEAARGGMGPHGLCVGATGSGKSEFLRTLVLGLAATHDPEELNLVLVDFKGGATFLGTDRLRHVAAVVTNLAEEAHLVARMHDALAGEMTRRQRLLRTAGHAPNVDAYAAARARDPALAPLPALLIVVDEFSELLSQHPDFADLFVAIGRVGRSLGLHLLLASQRLDEGRLRGLETHLSYRVCLKTFSAMESRAVLGTTDAYDLPATPGTALLATAAGELIRFRGAYVSAPVEAAPPPAPAGPSRFTRRTAESPSPRADADAPTLLDVVLDGLAERGRPAHRVWLPPLSASPPLAALRPTDHAPLTVPIALVDNPFAQRRETLVVDLRGAGGHVAVVGGPRSGKSTALHTLLLGLTTTHPPTAVHVYVLDLGGGTLAALDRLPHVGAIAGRADRELARRIVAHVRAVVREREARRQRGADTFLVVDGWAVLRQEFDGLEEAVTALAVEGLSFGVHVVVTASRWADLRPALKDQLGTRIELCLGDPADSEMDRKRARGLGARPAGHGLTREGLEFVVALPLLDGTAGGDPTTRHPGGPAAPPVRLLPSRVPHAEVVARCPDRVAIGLDEDELVPVALDFDDHPHLLILGDTECGKTAALRTVCREIVRTRDPDAARILLVDVRRTLLDVLEPEQLLGYAMSAASADAHVAAAVTRLRARLPGEHVTQRQLRDRSWWSGPDVYVVVDDYDLVAGPSGNPLLPMLDLLPHARDLGLHVVVARRSGGAARALFDPLLARLRELGCTGLMMSAHPDEGVLLGTVRPGPLPPGRGTLIQRGRPDRLVQVSWTEPP